MSSEWDRIGGSVYNFIKCAVLTGGAITDSSDEGPVMCLRFGAHIPFIEKAYNDISCTDESTTCLFIVNIEVDNYSNLNELIDYIKACAKKHKHSMSDKTVGDTDIVYIEETPIFVELYCQDKDDNEWAYPNKYGVIAILENYRIFHNGKSAKIHMKFVGCDTTPYLVSSYLQ